MPRRLIKLLMLAALAAEEGKQWSRSRGGDTVSAQPAALPPLYLLYFIFSAHLLHEGLTITWSVRSLTSYLKQAMLLVVVLHIMINGIHYVIKMRLCGVGSGVVVVVGWWWRQ